MRNVPADRLLLPPMQWTAEEYAGFSDVPPWEFPDKNREINVEAQLDDPFSLFVHYRTLISVRNTHQALRTGEMTLLSTDDWGLFACLRTTGKESMLVLINLSNQPIRNYQLTSRSSPLAPSDYIPVSLLDGTRFEKLSVLDNGRIVDYIPIPEISPYSTIMMV